MLPARLIDRMIAAGVPASEAGAIAAEIYAAGVMSATSPKKSGATRMADYRDRREELGLPRVFRAEEHRRVLVERDGERCIYCEATDRLVIDHIHPIFMGGCDDIANLGLACRACNGRKAGRSLESSDMSIVVESARRAHEGYKPRTQHAQNAHEHCAPEPRTTTHTDAHVRKSPVLHREKNSKDYSRQNSNRASRGTRIDPNWLPSEADRLLARQEGLSDAEIDREAARFRDYWTGRAGAGGVKLDWSATWRNWIRTAAEKLGKRPTVGAAAANPGDLGGQFYAKFGSAEQDAWDAYGKSKRGKSFPRDAKGGWLFPSQWPPGHKPSTGHEAPAIPPMRTMQ